MENNFSNLVKSSQGESKFKSVRDRLIKTNSVQLKLLVTKYFPEFIWSKSIWGFYWFKSVVQSDKTAYQLHKYKKSHSHSIPKWYQSCQMPHLDEKLDQSIDSSLLNRENSVTCESSSSKSKSTKITKRSAQRWSDRTFSSSSSDFDSFEDEVQKHADEQIRKLSQKMVLAAENDVKRSEEKIMSSPQNSNASVNTSKVKIQFSKASLNSDKFRDDLSSLHSLDINKLISQSKPPNMSAWTIERLPVQVSTLPRMQKLAKSNEKVDVQFRIKTAESSHQISHTMEDFIKIEKKLIRFHTPANDQVFKIPKNLLTKPTFDQKVEYAVSMINSWFKFEKTKQSQLLYNFVRSKLYKKKLSCIDKCQAKRSRIFLA